MMKAAVRGRAESEVPSAVVGGVLFPAREIVERENGTDVLFRLDGCSYRLCVESVFDEPYLFLEQNNAGELLVKDQVRNRVLVFDESMSLTHEIPVVDGRALKRAFTVGVGRFLTSSVSSEGHHFLEVSGPSVDGVLETCLPGVSWHGAGSIDCANGVVMFGEYPYNRKSDVSHLDPAIWRSPDGGRTWTESLRLPYPDIRHWHTVQHLRGSTWLATAGDTPDQCKWFISHDDGGSWSEVQCGFESSLPMERDIRSCLRTTSIVSTGGLLAFGSDDLHGDRRRYFEQKQRVRASSSRFLCARGLAGGSSRVIVRELCPLGLHVRSCVEFDCGWLLITEGQHPSRNWQVLFVPKAGMSNPYHLLEIESGRKSGGTNSCHGPVRDGSFYSRCASRTFRDMRCGLLRWSLRKEPGDWRPRQETGTMIRLYASLWFLHGLRNVKTIDFAKNGAHVTFKGKSRRAIYLVFGSGSARKLDREYRLLECRSPDLELSVDCEFRGPTSVRLVLAWFDRDRHVVKVESHELKNGRLSMRIKRQGFYIKPSFRFSFSGEECDGFVRLCDLMVKDLGREEIF